MTKRRHDLIEVVPPGQQADKIARATRDRLVNEVGERRNPRTNATVDQLLARHLDQFDGAPNTLTCTGVTSATTSRRSSAASRWASSTPRCWTRSTPSCADAGPTATAAALSSTEWPSLTRSHEAEWIGEHEIDVRVPGAEAPTAILRWG